MSSIKETITALTTGDELEAVRIKREARAPISEECFSLVVKSATKIIISISGAVVVLNANARTLVAIMGFGLAFALIYFGFRD